MSLELAGVHAGYGETPVLRDVDLTVERGEVVALVGSNGAGKTTIMRVAGGLLSPMAGRVRLDGCDLSRQGAERRWAVGIGQVPEGRELFPTLSVHDNLELGAYRRRGSRGDAMAEVFDLFPELASKRLARADTLSGGQAQMLAIGRALMMRPEVLLVDEPSLGLAPQLVERVLAIMGTLAERGLAILLAEQNAAQALAVSDRGYVLLRGAVVLEGRADELLDHPQVVDSYLGGVVGSQR